MRTLVVAEMTLREIGRRRSVLVILALLPLAFYLTRRGDHLGQSIRFVCLGSGWALSTAALFAGNAARGLEPRLRLAGYATHQLVLGRLCGLWALGLALAAPYMLLIYLDQEQFRYPPIAAIMLLTVAVAAPFGLVLSALLPRELEGTLVLLVVVGLQMMIDPADAVSRFLPFWFTREIGTYAVDHTDDGYLRRGLIQAAIVLVVLMVAVVASAGVRLRRRPHLSAV